MIVLATDIVRAGGALRVRARGGSMLPTIPRGALVRIGAVPPAGVTRGDVVLALTSDGEPVLHRAIAVCPDAIVTRGDAAIHVDPAVPLGRIDRDCDARRRRRKRASARPPSATIDRHFRAQAPPAHRARGSS